MTHAEAGALSDVNPSQLRRSMGRFTTGVALVLTEVDGVPYGATINSLTWVSLAPPLVLVSMASDSQVTKAIQRAGRYSIGILSKRQERIASEFAKPGGSTKFTGLPIHRGPTGLPVVPDALSTLECSLEREVVAGDHAVLFGRVHHAAHRAGEPLAFFSGRFGEFIHAEDRLDLWL